MTTAAPPLLLGILRGADAEALRPLMPRPGGWEPVLDGAARHGLSPFLLRWLVTADPEPSPPPSLLDRLRREVFGIAARNLLLSRELGRILRAFEDERLACAPLRGPALAEWLHGDVTARPIGDLDLLVRKRTLPRATAVLERLGFRPLDRRPGFAERFSYTTVFLKDAHGWVVVEPHWTIVYPPVVDAFDMEPVWERCRRGRAAGVETWLLGREDLLLHLCLHVRHADDGPPLLWLYEVDRLIRRERAALDWPRLLAAAQTAGVEPVLGQALGEVQALFGSPIPDGVLSTLTGSARRGRGLSGRLAARSGIEGREELAMLFALGGLRAKLRYATGLLFPCAEYMRIQFGLESRRALARAYARRVCRVAWAAVRGLARLPGPGRRESRELR